GGGWVETAQKPRPPRSGGHSGKQAPRVDARANGPPRRPRCLNRQFRLSGKAPLRAALILTACERMGHFAAMMAWGSRRHAEDKWDNPSVRRGVEGMW